MDEQAPEGAHPHPDAARAREIVAAIERLRQLAKEALKQRLNPELIEDVHFSIARQNKELGQIFE